mgnify:CR=1 FL=1
MTVGIPAGNAFGVYVYALTATPAAVAANTSVSQFFTLTGLKTGDLVHINNPFPHTVGTGVVGARVSGANQIEITFCNFTGGSLTPAAGGYQVTIIRPEKNASVAYISD